VACAGARPAAAADAAGRLVAEGCKGLVSFGLAGGLDAACGPGTIVIADRIVATDGATISTDPLWRHRLASVLAPLPGTVVASLLGCDQPALTPAQKQHLHASSAALAIDMESWAVAEVAAALAVPFVAVRVIADPASRSVPAWLLSTVDNDGRPHIGRVVAGLLRRPQDLLPLVRLAADSAKAFAVLRGVALRAGPVFQFRR
jgi:hopanoid-associated phosphorylase